MMTRITNATIRVGEEISMGNHLEQALTTLIQESRNWGSASRGLELFHAARDMLQNFYHVDSGYFVYKKQVVVESDADKRFQIYAPWGMPSECQDVLFEHVLGQLKVPSDPAQLATEKWVSVDEADTWLQSLWRRWGISTGGSWVLTIGSFPVGMAVFHRRNPHVDDTMVMRLIVRQISLVMEMLRYRRQAEEVSQRDPLTGIYNRRGATMRIQTLLALRESGAGDWIFAIFDLNDFKAINDRLGHPQGDGVLMEVARILSSHFREGDICGRWGGDEFVIMFKSPPHLVPSIIERVKSKVKGELKGVSLSAGWAVWGKEGTTLEEIYRAADKRLYQDKRQADKTRYIHGEGMNGEQSTGGHRGNGATGSNTR